MITLLVLAVAAVAGVMRMRPLAVRLVFGSLAIVVSATEGIAIVNDYYAYYQSWSQLSGDLTGSYSNFNLTPTAVRRIGRGQRPRRERAPARCRQRHRSSRAGLPSAAVLRTRVDAPKALDDTYLTREVRADVLVRLRASRIPAEWGVAGFSSGGYCAANLALRHRASFGAAGIMDGYFRPDDGPAAAALHFDHAAENANDPLLAARRLTAGTHPLPSFWLMAGTGDEGDYAGARAFLRALHGVDAVELHRQASATHNYAAWRAADPAMLSWLWSQLAPPSLRVQFPLTVPVGLGRRTSP